MQKLVHPKDTVSELERSNIVYCIPCADCSTTYVGETNKKLGKRLAEHRRAVPKANFKVSALAEHVWKLDHRVDWEKLFVLDFNTNLHEDSPWKLPILEGNPFH